MIHEDFARHRSAKAGSDRAFGWVFTAVFLLVGLWPLFGDEPARAWSLAVAMIVAACAWFVPSVLAPFNRLWLRCGELLHRVVSPLALGIMFFGVITPVALVMRLFGRDELRLKRGSGLPSYWVPRDPPGPPPGSFGNQF